MSDVLDAALAYAEIGWHVFPLKRDKKPLTIHGFKNATTDAAIIRDWFEAWPDANVGVWLRASGLIAIDVDPRNGGDATFAAAERAYGVLPRTCHAISASGGQHFIMRDPGGKPRGTLDHLGLGKGVDVKCNGYVLLSPSEREDGSRYTWVALDEHNVPPVPDAWLPAVLHPENAEVIDGLGIEQWATSTDGALSLDDIVSLRAALAALGPRKGGNSTTFKATRIIFHDYGLSVEDGWPYLAEWNERCGAPHTYSELERKVCNAADVAGDPAYGQRGRARKSLTGEARIARAGLIGMIGAPAAPPQVQNLTPVSDISANVEPAPASLTALACAPVEVAPPAPAGSYLATLAAAIEDVARYSQTTGNDADERAYFMPAGLLFGTTDEPPAWLIERLLIESGIGVVATEPKSAKTWIATELAVAVATGTKAFGRFATLSGSVAYFYTEDLGAAIKARVRSLLAGRGLGVNAIARTFHAQPRGRDLDLSKLEDCARVIASCRACEGGPIRLLVLDPLRNIHNGEEDKADSMSAVFRNLRMIATLLDCTILLVHHSAKASENSKNRRPGQRMRGSGAIHGFMDSGMYLEDLKTPDPCTFTNTVKSEVKAAAGAGVFELTLKITDNPVTGSAIKAVWEIGDTGATDASPEKVETWREVALDIVDAFYAHKITTGATMLTTKAIGQKVKGKSDTRKLALDLARREGWLRQEGRLGSYHITPIGEAISRERNTAPAVPDAPAGTHPAGNFRE